MDQELLTLPEQLSSPPVFKWGSCYSIFSFMCMFCRSLFVLLLLAIVLSVLLRFTDSDYAFVIFKLFLHSIRKVPRTHLCLLLRASSVFNSSSTTIRYSFGLYLDGRKCVVVSYQVVSAGSTTERNIFRSQLTV